MDEVHMNNNILKYNTNYVDLTFPEYCRVNIGKCAFYDNTNLTGLQFCRQSNLDIGRFAFKNTTNLEYLKFYNAENVDGICTDSHRMYSNHNYLNLDFESFANSSKLTTVVFDEEGSYEFDNIHEYHTEYFFENRVFSDDLCIKEMTLPLNYNNHLSCKPFMNLRNCYDYYIPYTSSYRMLRDNYGGVANNMLGAGIIDNGTHEPMYDATLHFDHSTHTDGTLGEDTMVENLHLLKYVYKGDVLFEGGTYGDITNDGEIDIRDVTKYARIIVHLDDIDITVQKLGDIIEDGSVDIKDFAQLKKYLIKTVDVI